MRRLIAAALKDIITPDDLFEGVKMTLGRNEAVHQYMPVRARGSDLDTKSISHLSAMSHRTYEYTPNGEFGAEGGTEGGAAGGAAGVGKPSVAEAPLPVARDRKGRELAESWRAQRRLVRRAQAQQKEAAQMAAELARCQQSKCLWCRCDTRGNPYCNFTAASAVELDAHLKANKHSEGKLAPFKTGVAAGRGAASDRDAAVMKKVLTAGASSSSHRLETNETLKVAEGFVLTYGDGRQYEQAAPADGWARAQRLPTVHSTPAQLEFVYYAFTIGETFTNVKFLPVEAQQLMAKVGTAEIAARYPGHPYFGVVLPKPRFSRTAVLEDDKIKSYFGQGAAKLKRLHENAQARGAVEEDDGLDSDIDDDGLPRPEKRRKRPSGGGGGGRRAASNAMAATDAVSDETPLAQLTSKLVLFSGIGAKVAANIAQTTSLTTCGELARAEPQAVDQWKVPRFTRLRELHDALRRWLVDGERGAPTSSSSADLAPAGRGRGRGGAAARGRRGRGRGGRGRGRAAAAAAAVIDGDVLVPLSKQRSLRACYEQQPSRSTAGACRVSHMPYTHRCTHAQCK